MILSFDYDDGQIVAIKPLKRVVAMYNGEVIPIIRNPFAKYSESRSFLEEQK